MACHEIICSGMSYRAWNFCSHYSDIILQKTIGGKAKYQLFSYTNLRQVYLDLLRQCAKKDGSSPLMIIHLILSMIFCDSNNTDLE